MNPLQGSDEKRIDLDDVRSFVVSQTLADKPVPKGGKSLMQRIALDRVAREYDIADTDWIEIEMWDSDKESLYKWWYEMWWRVWCDLCHNTAVHNTDMDGYLCQHHTDEAYKQEMADLDNDDRAIGMMP